MSEEEFMKSTPKKLFKLADIHHKLNSPADEEETEGKKEPEMKYIDEIL